MQATQCRTCGGVLLAMACWQAASAPLAVPAAAPAVVEAATVPSPTEAVTTPAAGVPAAPVPAADLPPAADLAAPPALDEPALAGAPAIPAERLDGLRGGADTVNNDLKLNGVVGSNTAVNVATGANIINDGAFANASGLPIVIQNSGANVLIQNATIINLQLK